VQVSAQVEQTGYYPAHGVQKTFVVYPQLLTPSLLPEPTTVALSRPVQVVIYYPLNVTENILVRYTVDGSPVTNASVAYTNETQLGK
jgi:hypothetical protein